jgi:microcin C transport system substrate-binding protein
MSAAKSSRRAVLASLLALPGAAFARAETATPHMARPGGGLAIRGAPKYAANFAHFDYVNPAAPKGGTLITAIEGTFDSLNPFIVKGVAEWWNLYYGGVLHDSLMKRADDEPFTVYPQIARSAEMAPDRSWLEFELDEHARFNDATPIGVGDVLFSLETLKTKAKPAYRDIAKRIVKTRVLGPRKIRLDFEDGENLGGPLNVLADLPILSERYWGKRDFERPSLDPPVASGPYRVAAVDGGRSCVYERVRDYWAAALPANVGFYNFDTIRVENFLDSSLLIETVKSGEVDFRVEGSASKWSTAYEGAALRAGTLVRHRVPHRIPQGLQGFFLNTRRWMLKDWRVRRALALAFDFEWANKNLMHGIYTRSASYFANSEMESSGLPEGAERAILEGFRGLVAERVFTEPYTLPVFKDEGDMRRGLRAAFALLKEAGFVVRDMKLVEAASGRRLSLEFLLNGDGWVRLCLPYIRTLKRLGIEATVRLVDDAQYQNRLREFDFDVIVVKYQAAFAPGQELVSAFQGKLASRPGSFNYSGINDRVVDALLRRILRARDQADLVASCRALDRVLLHHHLAVPHWHITYDRYVHWDKFGYPATLTLRGSPIMTWWVDPAKAAALRGRIRSLR